MSECKSERVCVCGRGYVTESENVSESVRVKM